MHSQPQWTTGLVMLFAAALVVFRTLRPQTVRVWALIATPAVLFAFAGLVVAATPPASLVGTIIVAAGALLGAALGYARGIHSRVALGPRPGTLIVSGNAVLVALLLAAFAVRMFARALFGTAGPQSAALSDAVLVFAATSVGVARGLLFFSWQRLRTAVGTPAP